MRTLILTVGPDSIRLALYGMPFQKEAEGFVWAIAKVMVGSLFLAGHDTVIMDATNTTIARQEDWNDVAERFTAEVRYKVFYTMDMTCKERAVKSQKEYLIPVIDRMTENWEHPPIDKCL
jgi:predicted kinase